MGRGVFLGPCAECVPAQSKSLSLAYFREVLGTIRQLIPTIRQRRFRTVLQLHRGISALLIALYILIYYAPYLLNEFAEAQTVCSLCSFPRDHIWHSSTDGYVVEFLSHHIVKLDHSLP